ncbi:MAG TPA: EAL domain-containing protein [Bauldia sp.]|nr:EAL domain-containing protein [Bauldia sp.]
MPTGSEAAKTLCFVVDDEPAIGHFMSIALKNRGVETRVFTSAPELAQGLGKGLPGLIFLDVTLGTSDAIEAIRALAAKGYGGAVQLMSGRDIHLLEEVRRVGERHRLRMLPVLQKPFRVEAVYRVLDGEKLFAETPRLAADARSDRARPPARAPRISLADALRSQWLELWYQPKLDLRRRRVIGAEGLARVRHPEFGMLLPGSFIPGASVDDLVSLSEYALHAALEDAREFAAAGHPLQFAINVPVEALLRLPIPQIVREHRMSDERWSGIVLEVTEDQIIRDIASAHEIATQLRIYHISLAIDDFGRGYSSLARLKELPFAELKLDQSFVSDCGTDPTNAALCRTAVELAHRFGSLAVAEGIETPSDLAAIARLGCDLAQGFIFAHAMPKEFLLARLMADGGDGGFGAPIGALGGAAEGARYRQSA